MNLTPLFNIRVVEIRGQLRVGEALPADRIAQICQCANAGPLPGAEESRAQVAALKS